MKLTSNNLLIRRVPTTHIGLIHVPPSMLDEHNNGLTKMFKLISKGPGRTTRKGATIPFEAEPGDNLIVFGGITTPLDNGDFILKNPELSVLAVLAVIPMQSPPATPASPPQ